MTKKEQEQKIKEIVAKIVKEYKPEKIILFGSWAWGKPGPNSDVDLFVIKKSHEKRIEREMTIRKLFYKYRLKTPVDVLVYTPKEVKKRLDFEDFFIEDIINNGKTLYEYKT